MRPTTMTPEARDFAQRLYDALGPNVFTLRGPLPPQYRPRFVRAMNVASQALARGDMELVRAMRVELDRIIDTARPEIEALRQKAAS